jgi:hypothetical protein
LGLRPSACCQLPCTALLLFILEVDPKQE